MVFRRGAVLLCIAAAVALADVGVVAAKDVALHPKAATETQIDYPNGSVMISTKKDGKKTTTTDKKQKNNAEDSYDSDSSDDKHKKKNDKKVEETVAKNGEIMRKYAHGSVRIFKKDASASKQKKEHLHKAEVVKEIHATTGHHKHEHAEKEANGDIVKDFDLKEGVNEFDVQGVPLKITVNNGEVDVNVNGKHVSAGEDITVEAPASEKEKKEAHSEKKKEKKEHKKAKAAEKKKEKAAKKEPEKQKKAAEVASVKEAEQTKVAVDAKAERVTELATKLAKNDRGFFSAETAPIVFICGIIGALAAVVGIAAVAVARARGDQSDDVNLQSVLADSGDIDIEAAIEDAPADQADSLEDSESDDDDDEEEMAGEGTFANNEHATVSV